jgi:hypothetical protein
VVNRRSVEFKPPLSLDVEPTTPNLLTYHSQLALHYSPLLRTSPTHLTLQLYARVESLLPFPAYARLLNFAGFLDFQKAHKIPPQPSSESSQTPSNLPKVANSHRPLPIYGDTYNTVHLYISASKKRTSLLWKNSSLRTSFCAFFLQQAPTIIDKADS